MSKQETKKVSKIVGELMNYLLQRGYTRFEFALHREQERTTIVIELPNVKKKEVQDMIEKVGKQKDREVEMYGWELIGEAGYKDQLEVLGRLIDSVHVEETQDYLKLTFIRTRFEE